MHGVSSPIVFPGPNQAEERHRIYRQFHNSFANQQSEQPSTCQTTEAEPENLEASRGTTDRHQGEPFGRTGKLASRFFVPHETRHEGMDIVNESKSKDSEEIRDDITRPICIAVQSTSREICDSASVAEAIAVDAFSLRHWEENALVNPPLGLIPKVLEKAQQMRSKNLLFVMPMWPSRPWWPILLQNVTEKPLVMAKENSISKNSKVLDLPF